MFRYVAINIFGLQLVSAQTGAEHRRLRSVVKGCFNEEIMYTTWWGMASAVQTFIIKEGLEEEDGGVIEDTREMMIKVSNSSHPVIPSLNSNARY